MMRLSRQPHGSSSKSIHRLKINKTTIANSLTTLDPSADDLQYSRKSCKGNGRSRSYLVDHRQTTPQTSYTAVMHDNINPTSTRLNFSTSYSALEKPGVSQFGQRSAYFFQLQSNIGSDVDQENGIVDDGVRRLHHGLRRCTWRRRRTYKSKDDCKWIELN